MSRTRRGGKGPGYEYWSRRPGPDSPGKENKRICHQMERQHAKRELRKEILK